jgi:hypothetical protein
VLDPGQHGEERLGLRDPSAVPLHEVALHGLGRAAAGAGRDQGEDAEGRPRRPGWSAELTGEVGGRDLREAGAE